MEKSSSNRVRQWRQRNAFLNSILTNEINEEEHDRSAASEREENVSLPAVDDEEENNEFHTGNARAESFSEENDGGRTYSSESEEETEPISVTLAAWYCRNRITRDAMNQLLAILRGHGHLDLPKDARTLVKTPRHIGVYDKCGGSYYHLGLLNGLKRYIDNNGVPFEKELKLSVNIDGLPLYKSSAYCVWPILCKFDNDKSPFIISMFCGFGKPNSIDDFVNDFLIEYETLKNEGFWYHDVHSTVKIMAFICDAPARAFVKCIKSHTGYHSCERCLVFGEYSEGKVVFNNTNGDKRNDETFMEFDQYRGSHQLAFSPLISFNIPCISLFVLDYMHLVCLGVVRRVLSFLIEGPRCCRLLKNQLNQISAELVNLNGQFPRDFARQPRSLDYFKRWKATELRQFLLYTGPVVLKLFLPSDTYQHFLSLSIAMRLLLDSKFDNKDEDIINYANQLLLNFVSNSVNIYGAGFNSYNVHNLIHLSDDCLSFRTNLENISAFPFENFMQHLKKLVRSSQNPIAQVVKRTIESDNVHVNPPNKYVEGAFTKISEKSSDSWFLLNSNNIIQVIERRMGNNFVCDRYKHATMESFFLEPCDSKNLDIVFLRRNHPCQRMILNRDVLKRKLVAIPFRDGHVLLPLLQDVTWKEDLR